MGRGITICGWRLFLRAASLFAKYMAPVLPLLQEALCCRRCVGWALVKRFSEQEVVPKDAADVLACKPSQRPVVWCVDDLPDNLGLVQVLDELGKVLTLASQ